MIIVCGSLKGGVGKSTLATNLATLFAHDGKRTLLVDADEQRSSCDWSDQRDQSLPSITTISLLGKNLYIHLKKIAPDYDVTIIDSGGRDTSSLRASLTIANYLLIPFKPRSFDIWTMSKVRDLLLEVEIINPALHVLTLLNQADAKGSDNDDALQILNETPLFQKSLGTICNRKAFGNAASLGMGVVEWKPQDAKAVEEMKAIYKKLLGEISNLKHSLATSQL